MAIGGKKRGPGRPRVIEMSEELLNDVKKLAGLRCSHEDIASFFEVSRSKWFEFKADPANKEAIELAYEIGSGQRRVSLRRMQMQAAMKGNVTMLIWLGKQDLDQKDEHSIRGPGPGGSMPVIDYAKLSDQELDALEGIGKKLGLAGFNSAAED